MTILENKMAGQHVGPPVQVTQEEEKMDAEPEPEPEPEPA